VSQIVEIINLIKMINVQIVYNHVIHVLMKHNVYLAYQIMDISTEPTVLNHAQLDIGTIAIMNAKNVTIHVKHVMVLPKLTVLIVRLVYIGYTRNNVLTLVQKVIMETTLESVNHVTPLVKHVLGQELINVPNVKQDTINNLVLEHRDLL